MKISKIDNNTFGSNFNNNREMWMALNDASANHNRVFLKSAEAIVNDGKKDIIELRKVDDFKVALLVNGKPDSMYIAKDCILAKAGQKLIQDYAQKITGKDMEKEQFVFSPAEQSIIRYEKNVLDRYSSTLEGTDLDEQCEDFVCDTIAYAYDKLVKCTRRQIDSLSQYFVSTPKTQTRKDSNYEHLIYRNI